MEKMIDELQCWQNIEVFLRKKGEKVYTRIDHAHNLAEINLKEHLRNCLYTTTIDITKALGYNGFVAQGDTATCGKDGIALENTGEVKFDWMTTSYCTSGNYYKTFKGIYTASAVINIKKLYLGLKAYVSDYDFTVKYANYTPASPYALEDGDELTIYWKIKVQ